MEPASPAWYWCGMNARFDLRLDKDAFDRWVQRQEGRYEWKDGRVVQMTNVTRAHARIVANILRALSARLDLDRWSVVASDFGVEHATAIRFPDIVVEPVNDDLKSRRALAPVVLVEVLSPSSVATDFTQKRDEYTSFPTLEAYIIASQDMVMCWTWQRAGEGRAWPKDPAEYEGRNVSIPLPALGLDLPLADVYRGIDLE